MNTKQQQLLFDKGITNVPSDILCSDNTLEESVGMIYDNGEHRVIQKPSDFMYQQYGAATLLYIHKFNEDRYIYKVQNISTGKFNLIWGKKSGTTLTNEGLLLNTDTDYNVTSVGKTLVVTASDGMHYFLWQDTNSYKPLPQKIPEPQFDFSLVCELTGKVHSGQTGTDRRNVVNAGDATDIIDEDHSYGIVKQEKFNDLVVGLYSKNQKAICHEKGFCQPFFVRTAVEMYDGSYFYVSQPILMFPCVTENSYAVYVTGNNHLYVITYYARLFFRQTADLSDFSDIIKDITIFISDGIEVHDLSIDQTNEGLSEGVPCKMNGVFRQSLSQIYNPTHTYYETEIIDNYRIDDERWLSFQPLKKKDTDSLLNDIKGNSVFYKLCSVGLGKIDKFKNIGEYINNHYLENITTQESLPEDDYFSRNVLMPEFTYSYNSRLNLGSVQRNFFEGYDYFMPWDNTAASVYDIYVTIKTDTKSVVVKHTTPSTHQKMGYYFYYPDSRATNVVIYQGSSKILDAKLTEHPGLNGAYYLAGLPGSTEPTRDTSAGGRTDANNSAKEQLPNYIIQSEVNNPWVFKAAGYFKVGTGNILGMSSITQALSEGQFGQYPLLVFSESGIWVLSVASTGYYSSIHPMSREVCNNTKSITQTDGAVFFSSEKGLMVVAGNQVSCVSEQLNGRESAFTGEINMTNFHDYLKNGFIAYDYRDSLLWIFNNNRSSNRNYCYVYSIKHGTFGKFNFGGGEAIYNVVNNYPDTLLQGSGTIFSLTNRPNINDDTATYSGLMITRPMKFENGLGMKSLMQVKNLRQMQGTLQLSVYASNDIEHWVQLSSLRGTPWKYFRFRFDFSNMKATDRFAGSVIITQERRTDKLR